MTPVSSLPAQAPPVLSLEVCTYLGGSKFDHARDVAFDSSGNMIVVGGTESPGLQFTNSIVTPGSPESGVKPVDVFVAKFNPAGNLLWATVVGGPSYDRAYAAEVDAEGYIYVAGRGGVGFPVTPGAMQTTFMSGGAGSLYGNQDGFIFKMKPDGSALEWATYFGGSDASMIRDLAIDAQGNVYISSQNTAGSTYPAHMQEVFDRGPYSQPAGKTDLVVAKVKADGSELLWGMHLGGSGDEAGESSIRVDASGNPVVLTATNSTNIQTTPGAYDRTFNGAWDFYLAKVHSDGSGLMFATYLGGANSEAVETHHLAIDSEDNIIVAAGTLSNDFPIVGGYHSSYNGSGGSGTGSGTNYAGDAVIAKLSPDGSQLLASTFLGGRYGDQAEGVGVDAEGNVYVAAPPIRTISRLRGALIRPAAAVRPPVLSRS
ncbi:MAG: SBBP repeat-containing protein [Bryobacteraceae bacterium]|nr:SBBP repeat-containing protein [Bryobacteraceae bacterium]